MARPWAKLYGSVQIIQIARDGVYGSRVNTLPAITGIVFSALTLEAIVNELLDSVADSVKRSSRSEVATVYAVADAAGLYERHVSVERKVRVITAALEPTNTADVRRCHGDLRLLIQIRNFLVHTRPEMREQDDHGDWPIHSILHQLVDRNVLRPADVPQLSATINGLQNHDVAKWAYETMVAIVQQLVSLFPLTFRNDQELDRRFGLDNLAL